MNRKLVRIICCVLAALFVLSAVSLLFSAAYAAAPSSRDETVYVDMDADGNITGVVSSVFLGNRGGADTLTDYASLTGVKNISGLEAPKAEGDALTFKAEGEDVIYQGSGEAKNLPFAIELAYTLDGKPAKAAELAGKTGRLGITLRAVNKQKRIKEVDGEDVELYAPFTIVCLYTLGEGFSNITTSGKLTNQAGTSSVMGFLLPGLRESLDDLENDNIKDTFTIEADVVDLELPAATIIGMAGLVEESDLTGLDDVQDMVNGVDELESATKKLRNGAKELRDGSQDLTEGTIDLADGARKLADGTREAAEGGADLTNGIGESYKGVSKLYDELGKALGNGSGPGGGTGGGVGEDEIKQMKAWLQSMASTATPGNPNAKVAAGLLQYLEGLEAAVQQAAGAQGQMQQLYKGVGDLKDGLGKLHDGSLDLTLGLYDLADGTKELEEGAFDLADGSIDLTEGVGELYDGLRKLHRDGMQEMLDQTSSISVSLSRKDALLALAEEYTSFSATRPVQAGSVQFLFTVEEALPELPIEDAATPTNAAPDAEPKEERSFFQKIGDWFMGLFRSNR